MAKKQYKKKTYAKKKTYTKKSKYATKGTTVQLGRLPISQSQIVRMRYVERVNLNPAIGISASYIFSANGCYDPNITGIGHQPLGFDQWMGFYNHYTVIGSKINCQFSHLNGAVSGNEDMMVGIQLKAASTIDTTNVNTVLEQGLTKYKFLSRTGDTTTKQNVTKTFSPSKFFGIPKSEVQDDIYRGNTATNPTEQAFYHLMAMSTDSVSDAPALVLLVQIEYLVKMTERKPLIGS